MAVRRGLGGLGKHGGIELRIGALCILSLVKDNQIVYSVYLIYIGLYSNF